MSELERMKTLRPSTERRPLRMHSLRPVPNTITSYSSSMILRERSQRKSDNRTRYRKERARVFRVKSAERE